MEAKAHEGSALLADTLELKASCHSESAAACVCLYVCVRCAGLGRICAGSAAGKRDVTTTVVCWRGAALQGCFSATIVETRR